MKRYRFIACFCVFSFLSLYAQAPQNPDSSSNAQTPSHSTQVAEKEAIWNLNIAMSHLQDGQIISYLEKIENMPEILWHKTLQLSLEEPRWALRDYLMKRFYLRYPYYGKSQTLARDFNKVLENEYNQFVHQPIAGKADIDRILIILSNVKKWKIRELFYQTSALLGYPLSEVRQAANEAMAAIWDDRIYPILLKLTQSENPMERIYAVDSLYYLKDDRMLSILLQMLNDPNKSVRYYVIRSLDSLNAQEAIPFYIKLLRTDPNANVRVASADVLGKVRPLYAFNSLLESIPDPSPLVRRAVIKSLVLYNNVAAAYPISRQLALETRKDLKIIEIQALVSLNNSGSMLGLNYVLKNESDTEVLLWAIYATGKLGDYNGYDSLLEKLSDKNASIREEAAAALGTFKIKKTTVSLLGTLDDKKEKLPIKEAALNSLKNIDENSTIPALYKMSLSYQNFLMRAQIKAVVQDMIDRRYK